MAENNENGTANTTPTRVKIRTNIGWVYVPTTAGGITEDDLNAAIAAAKNEMLAKSDKINKTMAEQIYANSADISNRFE